MHTHAQLPSGGSNALVESQELRAWKDRPRRERGGEVNRVERPDRFHRERFPGALDDVDADPQQVPVRGGGRQVGPAVCRISFREVSERRRADQDTVTLDDREIGGDDGLGARQDLSPRRRRPRPGATPGPHWTRRTDSPVSALFIEELSGSSVSQQTGQRRIR